MGNLGKITFRIATKLAATQGCPGTRAPAVPLVPGRNHTLHVRSPPPPALAPAGRPEARQRAAEMAGVGAAKMVPVLLGTAPEPESTALVLDKHSAYVLRLQAARSPTPPRRMILMTFSFCSS